MINADSRQVFKEMKIGTARPGPDEVQGVEHYFLGDRSVEEEFSAGHFEREGLKLLERIFSTHSNIILSGGSGLYVDALCFGFDKLPKVPQSLRDNLNQKYKRVGIIPLLEELKKLDPVYYLEVNKQNPQRVIRSLEVCLHAGIPFSSFRKNKKQKREFDLLFVGLELPRSELYNNIDERVESMLKEGLVGEVRKLIKYKELNALKTVGYSEVFSFLAGEISEEEMVNKIKQNTRRYAKRQMTWFKKNDLIRWFHPDELKEIEDWIKSNLQT